MPLIGYIPFKILAWDAYDWSNLSDDQINTLFNYQPSGFQSPEGLGNKIYIIAESAEISDTANKNIEKLTMGHVNQPFINAGEFETTYTLSGHALLVSMNRPEVYNIFNNENYQWGEENQEVKYTISNQFLADYSYENNITLIDVPSLVLYLLTDKVPIVNMPRNNSETWDITKEINLLSRLLLPHESYHQCVIDKISLSVDDNGLNATLSWKGKAINPPAILHLPISTLIDKPLRATSGYDFILKYYWEEFVQENEKLGEIVGKEVIDVTAKNFSLEYQFQYDTPKWISRSQEPTYFLRQIDVTWSITGIFDLLRYHRYPERFDWGRSWEQYVVQNEVMGKSNFSNLPPGGKVYFKCMTATRAYDYLAGTNNLEPGLNAGEVEEEPENSVAIAIEKLFNALIRQSTINIGYKNDTYLNANRVSHKPGLSEITFNGIVTLT
jgi:hypothetical protein